MKPTVGRIVHYYLVSDDDRHFRGPSAAIVVGTGEGMDANLYVLFDGGVTRFSNHVPFEEDPEKRIASGPRKGDLFMPMRERHFWIWPPRV